MNALSKRPWPGPAPPPASPPPAPPRPPGAELPSGLRLRHQGLLALVALLGLIALLYALVLAYRASVEQDFDRLSSLALHAEPEAGTLVDVDAPGRPAQSRVAVAAAQVARVHERGRAVAIALGATALLGMAWVGALVVFFFARLTADIDSLRQRALAVVAGDRQPARTIDRNDELGELGAAIDAMVVALAAGEQALEIERRNSFHQEKMASIGALAAGVLNEIGNPIAAIDGLARAMRDERDAGALRFENTLCDPEHILHETARLRAITRQIAELAAAPSREEQLLSLNEILRIGLLLAHFDPRLKGVRIDTELDPQLPAVQGIGDRLLQLVINLLVNAAAATRALPERSPLILVTTLRIGTQVRMTIADNGVGMPSDTLARSSSPLFTAEPAGQGLGLPMCRHIARQHGGHLHIESTPDAGTSVMLCLPLPPP